MQLCDIEGRSGGVKGAEEARHTQDARDRGACDIRSGRLKDGRKWSVVSLVHRRVDDGGKCMGSENQRSNKG